MIERGLPDAIQRFRLDRRRPAILLGAVAALTGTLIIWHLPAVFPVEHFPERHPLKQYRIAGGLIGGFVAGLLSGEHDPGWLWGGFAAVTAGVGMALLLFLYMATMIVTASNFTVPPVMVLGTYSFFIGLPLFIVFLLGGFVGGFLGQELRLIVRDLTRYIRA